MNTSLTSFLKFYTAPFSRSFANKIIMSKPIETSIRRKINESFQPEYFEVINESSRHGVPKGSESHFKVVIISDQFEDVALLQRHRMVNKLLEDELKGGVHALSIVAKTPNQWKNCDKTITPSPDCRGGFGK